jgi:hypothetical protein
LFARQGRSTNYYKKCKTNPILKIPKLPQPLTQQGVIEMKCPSAMEKQTQSNPIQTQNKPNSSLSAAPRTQYKPNQTQFMLVKPPKTACRITKSCKAEKYKYELTRTH